MSTLYFLKCLGIVIKLSESCPMLSQICPKDILGLSWTCLNCPSVVLGLFGRFLNCPGVALKGS